MLQRLHKQARRFGAAFKNCEVTAVDLSCRPFKVPTLNRNFTLTPTNRLSTHTDRRCRPLLPPRPPRPSSTCCKMRCRGGDVITSSALVIATGAGAKWLGVPGEQRYLSKVHCSSGGAAADQFQVQVRALPRPRNCHISQRGKTC
jgi:thioredoxin reductase